MSDMALVYQTRGVPYNVVSAKEVDFTQYFVTTHKKDSEGQIIKSVRPVEQRRILDQTLNRPFKGGAYNYVIGGKTSDALPKMAALTLFRAAFNHAGTGTSPYWHTLLGGFKDNLRDNEHFIELELGNPSLIVLSNIATNSTPPKFEKVRDICELYSRIPKVFIVLGDDPYAFCAQHLFIPVNRVMCFD